MEVKLENLIEKIKKEGVEQAQKTSEEIINDAKQKAASIIDDAKQQANKIIEEAKQKATKLQRQGESALQQASRDTLLLVKERLIALFDKVFKKEISNALSPDFTQQLIKTIVEQWARDSQKEILVSKEDKEKIQELLFSSLKEELKNSIIIKVSDRISKGFRIGIKGEDVYYDFTDESITECLKEFVSPSLKEILNKKNG
ncbi:hypothetical protein DRP98_00045 [candidate division KSB1 bacterium]|nr:MAG: hypothetical protein DRP98_00045 [candidate division KSB1 bacterium]